MLTVGTEDLYNHLKTGTFGEQSNVLHCFVKIEDVSKECIIELDFSNLYGWCMMQDLPYGKVSFTTKKEEIFTLLNDTTKYILLSIDCSFTDEQKEKLKDWSPLPSKHIITWNELR